ncbi:MAG: protein kinase [Acidobacteria bacterium]|nr:protein kinase [Acidobacteriota bacterium]
MTGQTIAHYTILEKLGQGGMGVVHKAHDTRLDRLVALKFLPSDLAQSDTDKARFLQEARAAAALNHPNVCVIYEIREEGDPPFIAMEYVDGATLNQRLKDESLALKTAIDYAGQIAGALQAAHEKGIVHRDIKSENIMVTPTGQVKVMDFGLAKIRGAAKLTRESSTVGTAAYMPPELIQGREIDARADIFSFGVVFYEMLTGQLPFKGDYESAMIYSILHDEPEPLAKYCPGLSSELLHIVNRALEKDPADRYQSVADMRIDLKRLERDADRVSGGTSAPESQRPFRQPADSRKRARRVPLFLAAGLMALIGAGSLLFTLLRTDTDSPADSMSWKNSVAVLPFDDASPAKDQQYFCDGMTEEVITHLARNRELKVISKTSVNYFKGSAEPLPAIGRRLGVNNILEGSIRKQGQMIRVTVRLIDLENGATIWTDSFDRELKNVFDVQAEIAQAISEALHIRFIPPDDNATAMQPEVQEYFLQSIDAATNYTISSDVKYFDEAVDLADKGLAIDPDNALIYAGLAWIYNTRYALTGDRAYREPVIRYCIRSYQLNPNLAQTNVAMAYALHSQGQFDRAAHHMRQALTINPNLAEINHVIGLSLYNSGLENKAISYFKKAAEINPFNLFTPDMLGCSYLNCGRWAEAEAEFRKALDLSLSSPILNAGLAEILIVQNQADEAETCLTRSAGQPHGSQFRAVTAFLHAVRGEKDKALSVENIYLNNTGLLYAFLGMTEEALACLEAGSETSYLRLIHHPFYDSLRHEKRYQAVEKKLKEQHDRMNKIFADL